MIAILAAHRIPYAATLSLAHREDFLRKMQIARDTKGFRFLVMLSPCPTGWKSRPDESIELIGLAVRSGLFPLYEVYDGERYVITPAPLWRGGRGGRAGTNRQSMALARQARLTTA